MTRRKNSDPAQTESPASRLPDEAVELAEAIRSACIEAASHAYEDAGMRGLCREGAWEAAIGAIQSIDLAKLIKSTESADGSAN